MKFPYGKGVCILKAPKASFWPPFNDECPMKEQRDL